MWKNQTFLFIWMNELYSVTTGFSQFLEVFTIFLHTWSKTLTPLIYCVVNDALVYTAYAKRAASAASVGQKHSQLMDRLLDYAS